MHKGVKGAIKGDMAKQHCVCLLTNTAQLRSAHTSRLNMGALTEEERRTELVGDPTTGGEKRLLFAIPLHSAGTVSITCLFFDSTQ